MYGFEGIRGYVKYTSVVFVFLTLGILRRLPTSDRVDSLLGIRVSGFEARSYAYIKRCFSPAILQAITRTSHRFHSNLVQRDCIGGATCMPVHFLFSLKNGDGGQLFFYLHDNTVLAHILKMVQERVILTIIHR